MTVKRKKIDPIGIKNVNFTIGSDTDRRSNKWKLQRLNRGFDDTELWNLNATFAQFIAPRLKAFKENSKSIGLHPRCMTSAQWQRILAKMVEGFELFPELYTSDSVSEEKIASITKAVDLFHRWFYSLWHFKRNSYDKNEND